MPDWSDLSDPHTQHIFSCFGRIILLHKLLSLLAITFTHYQSYSPRSLATFTLNSREVIPLFNRCPRNIVPRELPEIRNRAKLQKYQFLRSIITRQYALFYRNISQICQKYCYQDKYVQFLILPCST